MATLLQNASSSNQQLGGLAATLAEARHVLRLLGLTAPVRSGDRHALLTAKSIELAAQRWPRHRRLILLYAENLRRCIPALGRGEIDLIDQHAGMTVVDAAELTRGGK